MSYKKTKNHPCKIANERTQKQFVKKLKRLQKKCKKEKCAMIFFDPVHQIHNSDNREAWQFKGKNGTKKIKTNTGRRRINIIGGINPITMKTTTIITEDNCDKTVVVSYLEKLRKEYPTRKKIYMILDNASYNRARMVREKAKQCNIQLVYLPPYSPNLNLIERLWKFFKKKITRNKYYELFDDFSKTIEIFFENIHGMMDELKTLLTFKFGIIKAI